MWMRSSTLVTTQLLFQDRKSLSVGKKSAERARVHASVQSVHATTQTREMCVVRGIVPSLTLGTMTQGKETQRVAPCSSKRWECLSSDVLVLRRLEKM